MKASKYSGKFELGKKYGKWTVINPVLEYNENRQARILVKCECGTEKKIYVTHLLSGKSTSCGCSLLSRSGSNNPAWKGVDEIPRTYINAVSNSCYLSTHPYNLTDTTYTTTYGTQGGICYYTGETISFTDNTATLTTFIPQNGYVNGNVVWVHSKVAAQKADMSSDEFIEMCYKVVERHPRPEVSQKKASNPIIEAATKIANKYK